MKQLTELNKNKMSNSKEIYRRLKEVDKEVATGFKKWNNVLNTYDNAILIEIPTSLRFVFNELIGNAIKMYKWKLLHYILPITH